MLLVRRYLAMAALFFWQGGFVFYASVVVPTGQSVLDSHFRQGLITQQVTIWLNISGAIALVAMVWECLAARDRSRWRYWGRIALWLVMLLSLGGLFKVHALLDYMLEQTSYSPDPVEFRLLHRLYLWVQTVQWGAAVVYLALALAAWRNEDRAQALVVCHRASQEG